jgi:5-methylcytosine-specific restriction protein A
MAAFQFKVGDNYQRRAVKEQVGAGKATDRGGPWDTGLVSFGGAHFIFCNIGVAGKTGHNYGNFWAGDDLDWSGATSSHRRQQSIKTITSAGAEVHVFYRNDSADAFTYAGAGTAVDVSDDTPVRVLWRFGDAGAAEEDPAATHLQSAKKEKRVSVVERNPQARRDCLKHYGPNCTVCSMTFTKTYGDIGAGFMHVHHLTMVSTLTGDVEVDPVADLRPVCPNCHAMLHRRKPPLTIMELQGLLQRQPGPTR